MHSQIGGEVSHGQNRSDIRQTWSHGFPLFFWHKVQLTDSIGSRVPLLGIAEELFRTTREGRASCTSTQKGLLTRSIHPQIAELLRKSIDPAASRYVQMLLRGDYSDKMPETRHPWLCACE